MSIAPTIGSMCRISTQTEVIDTTTDKLVGTIPDTKGVHGIAIATDLGKGFTSDGQDNDVTVFDIKTLKVLSKVKTGQNPDSIIYEPVTHRVFTFNGRSGDSTAIDAKTGERDHGIDSSRRQARVRADRRQRATSTRISKTRTKLSKSTPKTLWYPSAIPLLLATAPAASPSIRRS